MFADYNVPEASKALCATLNLVSRCIMGAHTCPAREGGSDLGGNARLHELSPSDALRRCKSERRRFYPTVYPGSSLYNHRSSNLGCRLVQRTEIRAPSGGISETLGRDQMACLKMFESIDEIVWGPMHPGAKISEEETTESITLALTAYVSPRAL